MVGASGAGGDSATSGGRFVARASLFSLAVLLFIARRRPMFGVLVMLALLAPSRPSSAVVCTLKGTGGSGGTVWSNSTLWSVGGSGGGTTCPPGVNDSAVFNTGGLTEAVDTNVSCAAITITAGFTGAINMNSGVTITTSGNFNQAARTFTAADGAIDIGGDFILSGGTS